MRIGWIVLALAAACSSSHSGNGSDAPGGGDGPGSNPGDGKNADGTTSGTARTIFVIPMENEPSSAIYGDTTYAPYINMMVMPQAAHTTMFGDELPTLPSEPHYVWMEAGTNAFSDVTFSNDNDPSGTHSTNSTAHLSTQLETAHVTWMSYQEDITAGKCPVASSGFYAAKHDPFVFFQDVVGATPSTSAALCIAHHKPYSAFAADLAGGSMPQFVFITPNLCHDMHGASGCPAGTNVNQNILAGDTWLKNELPAILAYASAHDGLVFITWDEGDSSNLIPFLALGPRIKAGSTSTVTYTHSSQLKSIEEILGVPVLPKVASANDFADMFQPGMFP
jgi:phosphatidylinositol-3-phosphatase